MFQLNVICHEAILLSHVFFFVHLCCQAAPLLKEVWDMIGENEWKWGVCGGAVFFVFIIGSLLASYLFENTNISIKKIIVANCWFLAIHAIIISALGVTISFYGTWGFIIVRTLVGVSHAIITIWATVWVACVSTSFNFATKMLTFAQLK